MTTVFGQVAQMYDDVRPGYPVELAQAIGVYAGPVAEVVEVGSGTGKGTEIFTRLGAPVTCVEPDERMAAVLQARFPQVTVRVSTFEQWQAPPGGVGLLGCALAWHWLDPQTRNERAFVALRPGGTLAVLRHEYGFASHEHQTAITAGFATLGLDGKPDPWPLADIAASGLFRDVHRTVLLRDVDFTTERYVALHQTFSPHLRAGDDMRARVLDMLRATVDGLGGVVHMRLHTVLVMARKP